MNKYIILSLTTSAIIIDSTFFPGAAFSQTEEKHPRVEQVERRIERQEGRIQAAQEAGKITEKQANRNLKRLEHQEKQLDAAEAKHGGHITKKEQAHLNRKLDNNGKIHHKQKHHNQHNKQ
jgi:hypothetical protein